MWTTKGERISVKRGLNIVSGKGSDGNERVDGNHE